MFNHGLVCVVLVRSVIVFVRYILVCKKWTQKDKQIMNQCKRTNRLWVNQCIVLMRDRLFV